MLSEMVLCKVIGSKIDAWVSQYLTGKSKPTLKVTREISKKLSIEPSYSII